MIGPQSVLALAVDPLNVIALVSRDGLDGQAALAQLVD